MSPNNPLIRLLVMMVAIAAALRLTWLLIEPLLPILAIALVILGIVRATLWYRRRW